MLLSNVNKNKGFTLAEVVVTIAIAGILAALAAPSLLRWLQQRQVDSALTSLETALKGAQREAIRKGRTCTVTIPGGNDQTLTSNPTNCLVAGDRELRGISIEPAGTTQIAFSLRGNTTASTTIRLSKPVAHSSIQKRCLAISNGLGIMRTGTYNDATSNCVTPQ